MKNKQRERRRRRRRKRSLREKITEKITGKRKGSVFRLLSPATDGPEKTPAGDGRGEAQDLARAHLRVDEGRGAHGPGCQHPLAGVDLTRAVGGVARTLGEGGAVKRLSGVLRKRKQKYIVEGKQEDWI